MPGSVTFLSTLCRFVRGIYGPTSLRFLQACLSPRPEVPVGSSDAARPVPCAVGHGQDGAGCPASRGAPASARHQGLVSCCWMDDTSLSYQTTSFILSLSSSSCCRGTRWHVPARGIPASPSRLSPFPHWHPQPTPKHIHLFLLRERAASGNRSINHRQRFWK